MRAVMRAKIARQEARRPGTWRLGTRRAGAWRLAAIAIAVLLLASNAPVAPTAEPPAPGGFIVQAASAELAAAAVGSVGGELTHRLEIIDAVGARLAADQLARLRARPGVRLYADRAARVAGKGNLKAGLSKGQEKQVERKGVDTEYPSFIDADNLHRAGIDGTGVTIAIIDSGVLTEETQIEQGVAENGRGEDRILAQYNAIAGVETEGPLLLQLLEAPGVATDQNGHGTHVSSVAASSYSAKLKGNGRAYNGVAPNADLVVVKAFDANGVGTYLDVIRGLDWVVANKDRYGIRVLNLSFSAAADLLLLGRPAEPGGDARLAAGHRGGRLGRQPRPRPDDHRRARQRALRDHRRRHVRRRQRQPDRRLPGLLLLHRPDLRRLRQARGGGPRRPPAGPDVGEVDDRLRAPGVSPRRQLLHDVRHVPGRGGGLGRRGADAAGGPRAHPRRRQVPADEQRPAGGRGRPGHRRAEAGLQRLPAGRRTGRTPATRPTTGPQAAPTTG